METLTNTSLPASLASTGPDGRPQRIVIFGATGKTGREVVQQALDRGFQVRAFARTPSKLGLEHDRLEPVQGDVLALDDVQRAVVGCDAVVVCLGMPPLDKSRLRTRGTETIIEAMRLEGVERIVCLSVMGLGESWNNLPWSYKAFVIPLILRRVVKDHAGQEEAIMASNLDWTVVRPPNVSDDQASNALRHGFDGSAGAVGMHVPRADLAGFMLDQLGQGAYHRTAVGVTV